MIVSKTSTSSKTYKYKSGDKPPKSSDYSSYKDYSNASYAYSKNKRAVTIARLEEGSSVSETALREAGVQTTAGGGYKYYDSATKSYVTTPSAASILTAKAEAVKQQKEIAALKATTTQKEKDVMTLQYGLQQGMFSAKAAEKARAAQQEIMQGLPEKEPTKTAIVIGGKTFTGTYGLKRVYSEPAEEKAPAIFRGAPTAKKVEGPFIPTNKKSSKETIDVTYSLLPLSSLFVENKGMVTESKVLEGKWASSMYNIRKGLETKEITAERKGNKGLADIYGFGSAVLYPFRTPESTKGLAITFGKGAVVGVGGTVLGLTTGPIIPTVLVYGGAVYGATQIPKLQEQIAEAQFLGPVAYREKLSETGAQAGAAIGGAYVGSLLVPATISAYKEWHDQWITSKGATTAKGDYLWEEGFYTKESLKDWEKTVVKSKFISEAQKEAVLQGKGDHTFNKGFLEKGSGKVLSYRQQDFFKNPEYYVDEDLMIRIKLGELGLPSQSFQTQIGFERFNFDVIGKTDLQLSEATRVQAAMKTNQWLGKWTTTPNLNSKASVGVSYPKFSYSEQYTLIDATGSSFFEGSYFRTGYYKPTPKLMLEYKPVGKIERVTQWIENIEYPAAPKVFAGKRASVLGDFYDDTAYSNAGNTLEEGPFSSLGKKGKSKLEGNQFENIGKVSTGQVNEPLVYDWEFFPTSIGGVFGLERMEEKSITKLNLNLFQEQKKELKQEQKLETIQISLLDLKQSLLTKQLTKQELRQLTEQRQTTRQKTEQKQITGQITEQITEQITVPKLVVPTITIPDLKLKTELKLKMELKPEPELTGGVLGFGGFRFPSLHKEKFGFSIPRSSRPKRREVTVEPFAGLYDVTVSQFMFGKGTHPAITRKEKEKFKRRIRESSQLFPTVELENLFFRTNKVKKKKLKK